MPASQPGGVAIVFEVLLDGNWVINRELAMLGTSRFGASIGIYATSAAVGDPFDSSQRNHAGSVHFFEEREGGWTHVASHSGGSKGDELGTSATVFGSLGASGAPLADRASDDTGELATYRREFCTGAERIARARCRDRNGVNRLKVVLRDGVPGDAFTVELTDGARLSGQLNGNGRGKVLFEPRPAGDDGDVVATWGCAATDQTTYDCP